MSVGAGVNERLAALTAAGTSVWLDQIRRSLITSGELERLERELSLRGVTSNPAIFEKAILGSTDYDEQIAELAGQGLLGAGDLRRDRDPRRAARLRRAAQRLGRGGPRATASCRSRWSPAFAHDTDDDARRRRASTGSGSTART